MSICSVRFLPVNIYAIVSMLRQSFFKLLDVLPVLEPTECCLVNVPLIEYNFQLINLKVASDLVSMEPK